MIDGVVLVVVFNEVTNERSASGQQTRKISSLVCQPNSLWIRLSVRPLFVRRID
jgi:hypothetical protein